MAYYIKIGSVTNAQRARTLLRANSIDAQIKRLENPKPGEGCGYVIVVDEDVGNAVRLLQKNGLRVLGADEV